VEPNQINILSPPRFATLSRSTRPTKPDSRANYGVMSGKPIGSMESTSISPSSIRYRALCAYLDAEANPDPDAASDFSAANAIAKTPGEDRTESLRWVGRLLFQRRIRGRKNRSACCRSAFQDTAQILSEGTGARDRRIEHECPANGIQTCHFAQASGHDDLLAQNQGTLVARHEIEPGSGTGRGTGLCL
jgi:hypothetical protein